MQDSKNRKGLFKRSQHVGPTSSNISLDATCWPLCWMMFDNVGRCWLEFKPAYFRPTLLAQQCCTILASFEQALSNWEYLYSRVLYIVETKFNNCRLQSTLSCLSRIPDGRNVMFMCE